MITLLSPAKTLDFETPIPFDSNSEIMFHREANQVARSLKKLSKKDIANLMNLSSNLADVNYQRFQLWDKNPAKECTRQAVFMFKGEVYLGLDPYTLNEEDMAFAQQHLRILSGMYGVLKPLDNVQAYRLEMGTKMAVNSHKNLYAFWDNKLANNIQKELKFHKEEVIVNLASNEYFKAVSKKAIKVPVVTPVFKDFKNGKFKVISFFAKKARGTMARWIIQNRIQNKERLMEFNQDGYSFSTKDSTNSELVFLRS